MSHPTPNGYPPEMLTRRFAVGEIPRAQCEEIKRAILAAHHEGPGARKRPRPIRTPVHRPAYVIINVRNGSEAFISGLVSAGGTRRTIL